MAVKVVLYKNIDAWFEKKSTRISFFGVVASFNQSHI